MTGQKRLPYQFIEESNMFSEFILNFIVFILSLALLVVIHEFGHFITAKMFNVYVSEFSIGFGPALFTKKKENQETRFSIRAIPLGGYCAIVGESLPEFTEEEYAQLSDKDKELVSITSILLFSKAYLPIEVILVKSKLVNNEQSLKA